MSDRIFDNVQLTVKWKPTSGDDRPNLYPETGQDAQGYLVENLATKIGQIGRYLIDLRGAAFKEVESNTSTTATAYVSTNTKVPTVASVKAFVEGKGYVTSSGVTSITPGDGIVNGSGTTSEITSTGTLKAALKDFTKATVDARSLTNPTSNDKLYPVSLDKSGKLAVSVPWVNDSVTSAANHYTPSKDNTATASTSVDASSSTPATWGTTSLVTGVNVERDAKGHVTGLSLDSIQMPADPNTDRYVNSAAFTDDSTTNSNNPVKLTLTRAGSDTNTVTANIPKVSTTTAGVVPKGNSVTTQSASTKFLREDGTWQTPSYYTHPAGTQQTTQSLYKFKVDSTGHVTNASAVSVDTEVTANSGNLITSGAVASAIANLPSPMVFKGTVGTDGTVTTLATDGSASIGDTYKVITNGAFGGKAAEVGDTLVCITKTSNANTWELIPSGDDVEDTWRSIKVNGAGTLGSGISTGDVDFVNGTNTTVTFNATGNKIAINASHPAVTAGTDSEFTDTLTHGGTFTAVTGITKDTYGHTTAVDTTTYTLPAAYVHPTSYTDKPSGFYKIAVENTGHVSSTDPVVASDIKGLTGIDMTGANGTAAGTHGMVPAPTAADNVKFLRGDGTWAVPTNTDTKVNVTLDTTHKAYLLGTTTTPTSTAAAVESIADTGVYLDTTAGKLYATSMATANGNVICDGDSLTINCV